MKNILLRGGPGTGKTITARAIPYYVGSLGQNIENIYQNDYWADINAIEKYVQSDFVEYIQIHPSITYDDIVYGIEVKASGPLSITYAEKRIKKLCDRAKGKSESYFVILDDIGRTNSGRLLGNLLYALEYRNQPVKLADGKELIIPENVYFIITECGTLYSNSLEYAIRRRFDYEKELLSSSEVLSDYYNAVLPQVIKDKVLDVFKGIKNFVIGHILCDASIQVENYIPGHGMLIVDRSGRPDDILAKIMSKFKYQLWPYITDLKMSGVIIASDDELGKLYFQILGLLNVGKATGISGTVQKIFWGNKGNVPIFTLSDSKDYLAKTIIPNGCKEYRTMLESISDAIFLNGVLTPNKALSSIFLNTGIVQFEHRTRPGNYAAFMVETPQNVNFGYKTTSSNNIRSYYSTNPCRNGRWRMFNDAPVYKVTDANGISNTYVLLNALRNTGFSPSTVIHAVQNTASIYCALYLLVEAYLKTYESELCLLALSNSAYNDLYKLVGFEKEYWTLKHKSINQICKANLKLETLTKACLELRSLWNQVGTAIVVDDSKFINLINGTTQMSISNYEELYKIAGTNRTIILEGVNTMVNVDDYQDIMDSIGVRQMIFQGPPGTSKTFESKKFVLKQLDPNNSALTKPNTSQQDISNALDSYKLTTTDYSSPSTSSKLSTGGWDLVQFHPSYGYEDFIRGIEVKPVSGTPVYESVNRLFGKIAEFAKIAKNTNKEKLPKFYLIIDEINRANLATVFGELIYGLEYRNSKVSTPYEVKDTTGTLSKDIELGDNLYIVGTMNTADKSIDAIDYAIRRRFIFIDSPAKRDVVLSCYQGTMSVNDENSIELFLFDSVGMVFDDSRFFNEEYQKNDVKIGHTYFLRTSSTDYKKTAIEKFVFQVVPILREYIKDGILDSYDDKKALEHQAADIGTIAKTDIEEAKKKFAEEIMLFIKYFGEKDSSNKVIDNKYVADYIEDLCTQLSY